jgi:hypothetical protein
LPREREVEGAIGHVPVCHGRPCRAVKVGDVVDDQRLVTLSMVALRAVARFTHRTGLGRACNGWTVSSPTDVRVD